MSEVAIIGAGLIGRGWAIVFARAGWNVRVWDPLETVREAAPVLLRMSVADLLRQGLLADGEAVMGRIAIAPTLDTALAEVDLVQENGPEIDSVKQAIFKELDEKTPPAAILASSSSAIVASRFTEALPGRARCLIAHPVNPPHLVPVVELCGAPWTSADTLARAHAVYEAVGQVPVFINRELEGFVLNRLQGALLAEAFRLVGDGTISPADLDKTVKDGLGLRWSFMGPFETIDLNAPGGIADYCKRYTDFYRRLSEDPASPEVWDAPNIERILDVWEEPRGQGTRQDRSDRRDTRLAALRIHKRAFEKPAV